MNYIKNKLNKCLHNSSKENENGFSLLELVVAVGILLILTIGGVIGYSTVTGNAQKAAVEAAASDVSKGVAVDRSSGNSTDPQKIADGWVKSGKDQGEISVTAVKEINEANGDEEIVVTAKYKDKADKIAVRRVPLKNFSSSGKDNSSDDGGTENSSEMSEMERYVEVAVKTLKNRIAMGDTAYFESVDGKPVTEDVEKSKNNFFEELHDNYDRKDLPTMSKSSDAQSDVVFYVNITGMKDESKKYDRCVVGIIGEKKGLTVDEYEKIFDHYGAVFYDFKQDKFIDVRNITNEQMQDPDFGGNCHEEIEKGGSIQLIKQAIEEMGSKRAVAEEYYDIFN